MCFIKASGLDTDLFAIEIGNFLIFRSAGSRKSAGKQQTCRSVSRSETCFFDCLIFFILLCLLPFEIDLNQVIVNAIGRFDDLVDELGGRLLQHFQKQLVV